MRIALLTSVGRTLDAFFPPIVTQWVEGGHEVVAAASTDVTAFPSTVISSLSRRPSVRNLFAHRDISQWLLSSDADILVTNTAVASFLARRRPLPCKVVYFCHGLHWNTGHGITDKVWKFAETRALRNTDGVVVINDDDQTWFADRVDSSRLLRLPAGVGLPLDQFPRTVPPSAASLKLLWAGEFSRRKRPHLALDVLAELHRIGVSATLTMCGEGVLRADVIARAEKLRLSQYAEFPGQRAAIGDDLVASHALLMTSTWEGLPRVALEALAVGRPVFGFDVKGVRSVPSIVTVAEADPIELAAEIARAWRKGFSRAVNLPDESRLDSRIAAEELMTFLSSVSESNHV